MSKKDSRDQEIDPEDFGPMEEEKFIEAFDLVTRAGKISPVEVPDPSGFKAFHELVEDPETRVLVAATEYFGFDERNCQNFLLRFRAVIGILKAGELSPWILKDPRNSEVDRLHKGVLWAAAREPMNHQGDFAVESFLTRIKATARTFEAALQHVLGTIH